MIPSEWRGRCARRFRNTHTAAITVSIAPVITTSLARGAGAVTTPTRTISVAASSDAVFRFTETDVAAWRTRAGTSTSLYPATSRCSIARRCPRRRWRQAQGVSIDEYLSNRKDFVGSNGAVSKMPAPLVWNAVDRSARFIMSTEADRQGHHRPVWRNLTSFTSPQALLFTPRDFDRTWTDVVKITNGRPKRHEGT